MPRPLPTAGPIVALGLAFAGLAPSARANNEPLAECRVDRDDTVIRRSCRVVITPDTVLRDAGEPGVLRIEASNIVVEFAEGSVLRGAPDETAPDAYLGYGIRIAGQRNVTLRGVRARGFHGAIWATDADGLTIEDCDVSDNRRDRLGSTPWMEDGRDWLTPHDNDAGEWRTRYGAGIYVERSSGVTVRRCRARRVQNGLCLDRVENSRVYDNDFSFLSGWGIALWRSNRNVISRNALDFCIRGYSHGVYNRGQDSAGILVFEQCSENVFAENSATHGGDGFFGFAGREALGDSGTHPPDWYQRRGNSDNVLLDNDFSYAAAHGIEMTFSFGNRFLRNRLTGNAICGVWGGYSQDTLIAGNAFERNGDAGYGLERGGVNIEHGRNNWIVRNTFTHNRAGVHLWWDPEGDFAEGPWGRANGTASTGNRIARNTFDGDDVVFHLRGPSETTIGPNTIRSAGVEIERDEEAVVRRPERVEVELFARPEVQVLGETRPVGARPDLRGREQIVMTEWGPWDHDSPLVRRVEDRGRRHVYELRGLPGDTAVTVRGRGIDHRVEQATDGAPARVVIEARRDGVHPYRLRVTGAGAERNVRDRLFAAEWDTRFFAWNPADSDPREHLDAWRALARSPAAKASRLDRLLLPYGRKGPEGLDGDRFGMIARTTVVLPRGAWEVTSLSDDGVRVVADGRIVIENWTHHGPTRDRGELRVRRRKRVEIVVEHFEITGHAVLALDLAPIPERRNP